MTLILTFQLTIVKIYLFVVAFNSVIAVMLMVNMLFDIFVKPLLRKMIEPTNKMFSISEKQGMTKVVALGGIQLKTKSEFSFF